MNTATYVVTSEQTLDQLRRVGGVLLTTTNKWSDFVAAPLPSRCLPTANHPSVQTLQTEIVGEIQNVGRDIPNARRV